MAETFYSVLGVDDDADAEAIRSAYREQVKEHHPDVSDDPDAPERFKRLTTARDVLVDTDERTRYDRLGHSDYVRNHVETDVWTAPDNGHRDSTTTTSSAPTQSQSGYDRTEWLGEDGPSESTNRRHRDKKRRQRRREQRRRQQKRQHQTAHAAGGTTNQEDWQHASQAYRRAETSVGTGSESSPNVLAGLKTIGPWLVIHVVFIASAAATAWLSFEQVDSSLGLSWPTILFGIMLVGLVVFISVLHVISQIYS